MKRIFDYIIFALLLVLIGFANSSFLGVFFKPDTSNLEVEYFNTIDVPFRVIETSTSVSGYNGPIPMVVAVGEDDIIIDIKLLNNAETPTYLNLVIDGGYLNNWIGKSIDFTANNVVDGVSGATFSSDAISTSLRITMRDLLDLEISNAIDFKKVIEFLGLFLVTILALLSFFMPKKFNKFRIYLQVSAILVLGIWQGSMLSSAKTASWVINGVTSLSLFAICLLAIILPAITGKNFYCCYLCPYGAAQDIVSRTIKINHKIKLPKWLPKIRGFVLLTFFVMLIVGFGDYIVYAEPFSAFRVANAPILATFIFGFFLFAAMFFPRAWCKYFCPCGALLDLFKKSK